MSKNNLTANQAAVLTAILKDGMYIHGDDFSGTFESFTHDLADRGTVKDKKTAKAVVNQMLKKRLFAVDAETDGLTLTDAGKFAYTELIFEGNPEGLAEQEAHLEELAEKAESPADEDLIGEDPVKVETSTESYTATEWTEPGDEADIEWTETIFHDGSKTLKRRKKVSGAWRTDYWGTDAGADKQVFTTAKACKMARAYGSFNSAI
jgi:hypothetical protein